MKAIQLLINSYLPEDLRDYSRTYDAKDMNKLLARVANEYPDKFADILKKVSDLGRKASWLQGETITLQDLVPVIDKASIYAQMDAELDALPRNKDFKQRRQEIFQKYNTLIEKETARNALANRNNIAMSVLSGARGKNPQLKAMISTPGTFSDYKGRPIDIFSRESFAEGIRPATFLASTYGARSSVISTKCLEYQTLVRMADGSDKRICDIQVGEEVLGADRKGNTFPVKVLNVFDQGMREVRLYSVTCITYAWRPAAPDIAYAVKVPATETVGVVCTEEHKFLRSKTWEITPMKSFVSDAMEVSTLPRIACILKNSLTDGLLTSVSPPHEAHCFDIEVDHPDHLFVLANGLITSNSSTAKGGDWAKQMASAATDLVVRKENCGSHNGLSYAIDDSSLKGRALAKETAGVPAGTFIDREVLRKLEKAGVKKVVARSPITCSVPNGLCAHCVGKFYNGGKLPKVGDAIGLLSSSSVSEPVTQMALCISGLQQVKMADGTTKAIKDISVGDEVLGSDRKGNTIPVKVLNVFDQGERGCYEYTWTRTGEKGSESITVVCTPDHKFLRASGDVIPVNVWRYGQQLREYKTDDPSVDVQRCVETTYVGRVRCYDIEVDHPDHLFVLANGLICHNSAKHTAGMTQGKRSYSGLEYIQQFTQSPEAFKDRAAVAEKDGTVESVEEAPQGGLYVVVDGEKHYVPHGHEAVVKAGDTVEAGDQLSEGLIDPEDIVRLKGLGEGRKYYAERLNQMLADSGAATDKRNTEVLARAALRHVRITDPEGMGMYLPDDVADYNAVQSYYTPPETVTAMRTKDALGKYLQQPALHYSIGTRLTPKVVKDLVENDYNNVWADSSAPSFEPELVRLRTASHTTRDWLASMGTSYLAKQLNESATRGDDTNIVENDDFRPRLAVGAGFGDNVRETGKF